ncbi:MAG: CUAEP/CCAEP-tail radical SAM protein [Pseudolabrys sp.]
MKAVLISTYDLGHQPFGLASPAAWLRDCGVEVTCLDFAIQELNAEHLQYLTQADAIAFYLPMHTATRIGVDIIRRVRTLNPSAHLCAYGIYAPMNRAFLEKLGVETIVGGEYEQQLISAILDRRSHRYVAEAALPRIPKLDFRIPDRTSLPDLSKYAFLTLPDGTRRTVGYTEASRGCKHLCRHCPIVPVYDGQFRIVQHDVVMADIEQLIESGAEHISFGDPDFFNGPKHAMQIVAALRRRHPTVTYDVTIKIEHLIRHSELLPELKETGCAFVTSAVESVDDHILHVLGKGHTCLDFFRVVELFRGVGLTFLPTFVAFTPWITLEGYRDLLQSILDLDLVANVAPVQLAIRLLIPKGSRLLDSGALKTFITTFDEAALCYRWGHPDPRVDLLQRDVEASVKQTLLGDGRQNRMAAFEKVWRTVERYIDIPSLPVSPVNDCQQPKSVPYLSEPWYCCAEPTDQQMRPI